MDPPLPDCEFGHPFAQLRERVSDNAFELFQESVLHRTVTVCAGEACSDPHGRIAFVRDVRALRGQFPLQVWAAALNEERHAHGG